MGSTCREFGDDEGREDKERRRRNKISMKSLLKRKKELERIVKEEGEGEREKLMN